MGIIILDQCEIYSCLASAQVKDCTQKPFIHLPKLENV
jgi:hypothetical protein